MQSIYIYISLDWNYKATIVKNEEEIQAVVFSMTSRDIQYLESL
jgi:hypothetical protein